MIAIVFDFAVGVYKFVLVVDDSSELLWEALVLCFALDYLEDVFQEHSLLLEGGLFVLVARGDLEVGSLGGRVVLGEVLVQPHSDLSVCIEGYHLVGYLEKSYFLVAILEASQGFTKDVKALGEGEMWQFR